MTANEMNERTPDLPEWEEYTNNVAKRFASYVSVLFGEDVLKDVVAHLKFRLEIEVSAIGLSMRVLEKKLLMSERVDDPSMRREHKTITKSWLMSDGYGTLCKSFSMHHGIWLESRDFCFFIDGEMQSVKMN